MATSSVDRLAYGLRGHLNRFSHVVINVSDAERAVDFYEAAFPVRRRSRINGPAQRYAGFGFERAQCIGWVMESVTEPAPPGDLVAEFPGRLLHLVEWLDPKPVGQPYREANHVGIYRQNSLVGNLDEAYARVLAAGGRPYGPPSDIVLTPDGFKVRVFGFRDPDGSTLEMIGAERVGGAPYAGMMHHCNLNVRNLERSYRFYRDVIGLDGQAYLEPAAPQPAGNGSLGDALTAPDGSPYPGLMQFSATLMGMRSDSRSPLDVLEWAMPKPYGEPYPVANHLGIIRVGLEVDDIEAARARLEAAKVDALGAIETWDLGDSGTRRAVTFRDPDGIMLELVEAVPYPAVAPPWQ